jgi:1,4-dihydroxy-2-naphthoate octaprenyltransferase
MKNWIQAARLRTLPLSVSGIIVGSFYAMYQGFFDGAIFTLALLTTLGLQILSNFANDYGDGVKGTDNQDRIGPERAIQSGAISVQQMKNGIIITSILTFLIAVLLIYISFGKDNFFYTLLFLILGVASIVAALKYTIGNSAYGYRGLGDVFVFLFFGLLSVLGSYFLYSKVFDWYLVLPACSIGLLSAAVLNLNNMRDELSDKASHKNTLVVKIGGKNARMYHVVILILAMVSLVLFVVLKEFKPLQYLYLLGYIPLVLHLKRIATYQNPKQYDPELKIVALSTFLISVLLSIVMNVF